MRNLAATAVLVALPAIGFAQTIDDTASYRLPALRGSESPGTALSTAGELFLKRVHIEGSTAFDAETLRAVVQPYENRMVSSAELQTLRLALTRMYVERGYGFQESVLPDQTVVDGVVTFQAVEGTLVTSS